MVIEVYREHFLRGLVDPQEPTKSAGSYCLSRGVKWLTLPTDQWRPRRSTQLQLLDHFFLTTVTTRNTPTYTHFVHIASSHWLLGTASRMLITWEGAWAAGRSFLKLWNFNIWFSFVCDTGQNWLRHGSVRNFKTNFKITGNLPCIVPYLCICISIFCPFLFTEEVFILC